MWFDWPPGLRYHSHTQAPVRGPFGEVAVDGEVRQRRDLRPLWAGLALALATYLSLICLDRPLVRGDGLAYYMWLGPIAVNFSFDLSAVAERFAAVNEYQIFRPPGGGYATAFSFGPAVLLAPWYRLALLLPEATRVDLAHFWQYQVDGFVNSFFVMLGSNAYLLLGVMLSYRAALAVVKAPWTAAVAAFSLVWATPLLYYGTVEPYMAHATGTFLMALVLFLYIRPKVRWLWLGLALSAAIVVRWQLALVAVPMAVPLLWRRRWGDLAWLGFGALAFIWLVPLSWQGMFGTFWVVPAGVQNQSQFIRWPEHALDVLVSAKRGLFLWSPLTLAALAGLGFLWRRERALALVALTTCLLQVLINGSVQDWNAGWSFGMRRLTELYPLFVLGLTALLALPGRWRWPAWSLSATATCLGVALLFAHLTYANVVAGHGATSSEELSYWLGTWRTPRLTWQVIQDHYGPWAWQKPGP